jgi:glucokinase
MDDWVLAVDLGGTNLRMAFVSREGRIENRISTPTPNTADAHAIVSAVAGLADRCRSSLVGRQGVTTLAIAAPVIMDRESGIVGKAPNLPMLNGFPLRESLIGATGLEVVLENDATSAAVGEHWLGASRGSDNSICVTLGTGVGGGLIVNGQPVLGRDGTAGEIGHICVEPAGHPCGCGSNGCLEQYSSATAVVQIAREMEGLNRTSPSEIYTVTAKDLFEAAMAGDTIAKKAFAQMGFYLGIALAGLINVLNPEVIVLAGQMSAAWDAFVPETLKQIAKRAFREPAVRVKLVRAKTGDDAGLLGVAKLAFASP